MCMTIEAMAQNNLKPSAIVISESEHSPVPLQLTTDTISRFLPGISVVAVPRVAVSDSSWNQTTGVRNLINIIGS